MENKAEQERKHLNRKLMKRTFASQMKNDEEYKFVVFSRKRFLEVLNRKRNL